ncbi:DUF6538 domain-containing protein [Desulfovibrio sp. Huiquan2017]
MRRWAVYYFRQAVPADQRPVFNRHAPCYSLRA